MKPELKQRIEQINAGTAPKGYKKTKVGIVPEEWDIIKAKKVFRNRSDKKHDGTLEVLSVTQDRGVIPRSQVDIDIKYDKESTSSYKRVYTGDFVISLRSFQGGIEYSEYNGIVSPAYTVIEAFTSICDDYYRAYFKSPTYIQRLNTAVYGIRDGKNISFEDFSQIYIPFPPLPEQQIIAEILTAQDEVIALLQKRIELKQQQKKYLMQKLLSGEVRVGSGEWQKRKIKEFCGTSSGTTPSRKEQSNFQGDILWLSSGELKSKYVFDSAEKISEQAAVGMRVYEAGTVVIAIYGLEAAGIRGTCSIIQSKCTISQACMAFTDFDGIINEFFYYWYLWQGQIIGTKYAQGTKQQNLSSDIVDNILVNLPSLPEQEKIAEILSAQDNEIELLQQQLALEQQKKKALMQLLLTGKVRVKT